MKDSWTFLPLRMELASWSLYEELPVRKRRIQRLSRETQQMSELPSDNENRKRRSRERMKAEGKEKERRSGLPEEMAFLFLPRASREEYIPLSSWPDNIQNKRGTCQVTISAGTRTRNLWIRSPARSSIAPQRPHRTHSISTRTEKAHTFCITEPSQHPAL